MKFESRNLKDTEDFARDILSQIKRNKNKKATILALYGDLGAGKTAFTKALAKILGIKETVTSPTFVIEKIYKIKDPKFSHLIHIDAYRLDSPKELLVLGWEEIINDPQNLIVIEWADRVEELIPKKSHKIKFLFVEETLRGIQFPYVGKGH